MRGSLWGYGSAGDLPLHTMASMTRAPEIYKPPESLADGRYVLHEPLGTGGMATVFRVTDTWFGVDRALKLLAPHNASSEKTRTRFVHEARTMSVMDHPNIVRIQDIGTEGLHYYFVMELSAGGSLATYLRRHGRRPALEGLRLMVQVLRGLEYAHQAGVVHRDIKPHNMLLTDVADPARMAMGQANQVRLTDFGIARIVKKKIPRGDRLTGTGDTLGTLAYMSPEQRSDPRSCGPATDLYGVGATMYIMLTGRRPFDLSMASLDDKVIHRVQPELRPIVRKAVAHRPEDRFSSAREMADAILEVYEGVCGGDPEEMGFLEAVDAGPLPSGRVAQAYETAAAMDGAPPDLTEG